MRATDTGDIDKEAGETRAVDRGAIRIGGVPEHFNAPFHLAQAKRKFDALNSGVEWTDFPGGTGDMCKALTKRDVDVAVMLTEGTLVQALKDPAVKIVGVYVSTPATWGIHVGSESCTADKIEGMEDEAVFAISRFGSGSHLMAYVLAESLGWDTNELKFKVVGGLKGACEALPKNGKLVFMWEKFTTLPNVVDGTFKRIGEFPTPWPFFTLAANAEFLSEKGAKQDLNAVLEVVKAEAAQFAKGSEDTIAYIKDHYHIDRKAAGEWLSTVSWACEPKVDMEMLEGVGKVLHRLKKIETKTGEPPTATDILATTMSLATDNKE